MRVVFNLLIALFIVGVSVYPYLSFKSYYGDFSNSIGLDGLLWLKERSPDDYEGIMWLRENSLSGEPVLEAVGESYTTFARVSTFSGLPTVLGWRVHEWLWRGGFDIPSQRTDEVKLIYENPLSYEARELLRQYHVEYIFIGDREREAYPTLNLTSLQALGNVVFQSGETYILRVKI